MVDWFWTVPVLMSESGMAVGFDEMSEKVSVDGRAEPVPELPTTAVPELAPEAAPEVAEAAEDALLAVAEDVAWRARRAAASWADAATSAGPRSRRDKARGDFMEGPSWRFDKDRGGLGRGQKKTGATVARRPSAIYSSPYHTPYYPSLPDNLHGLRSLSRPPPLPRCLLPSSLCPLAARAQRVARSTHKEEAGRLALTTPNPTRRPSAHVAAAGSARS